MTVFGEHDVERHVLGTSAGVSGMALLTRPPP
jgi:hypothetical protein